MILGLFSDIHEDRINLHRALVLLEKQGADKLVCLGDIAGFSKRYFSHSKTRSAAYCWQSVKENCEIIIPGNHDYFAIKKITPWMEECGIPQDWYQLPLDQREEKSKGRFWLYEPDECQNDLQTDQQDYISHLPAWQTVTLHDQKLMLSHYVFPDLNGSASVFLPDRSLLESHIAFMSQEQLNVSVFGHMHPEGLLRIDPIGYKKFRYNKTMTVNNQSAWGIPCVVGGRNRPGIAVLDIESSTIKSVPLYSSLTRFFR